MTDLVFDIFLPLRTAVLCAALLIQTNLHAQTQTAEQIKPSNNASSSPKFIVGGLAVCTEPVTATYPHLNESRELQTGHVVTVYEEGHASVRCVDDYGTCEIDNNKLLNLGDACARYQPELENSPDDLRLHRILASYWLYVDVSRASEHIRRILDSDANDAVALAELAYCSRVMEADDEMQSALIRLDALANSPYEAQFKRAIILTDGLDGAIRRLRQLAKRYPKAYRPVLLLGDYGFKQEDNSTWNVTTDAVNTAQKLCPESSKTMSLAAVIARDTDPEGPIVATQRIQSHVHRALQANPFNYQALNLAENAAALNGDMLKTAYFLQFSLLLDPRDLNAITVAAQMEQATPVLQRLRDLGANATDPAHRNLPLFASYKPTRLLSALAAVQHLDIPIAKEGLRARLITDIRQPNTGTVYDVSGETAIHILVKHDDGLMALRYLFDLQGFDPNIRNELGRPPISEGLNSTETVAFMLNAGADPNLVDRTGHSLLDLAFEAQYSNHMSRCLTPFLIIRHGGEKYTPATAAKRFAVNSVGSLAEIRSALVKELFAAIRAEYSSACERLESANADMDALTASDPFAGNYYSASMGPTVADFTEFKEFDAYSRARMWHEQLEWDEDPTVRERRQVEAHIEREKDAIRIMRDQAEQLARHLLNKEEFDLFSREVLPQLK